ncbi:hypothetical protein, partial [Heyndrickxia coagulans]|uniref:hypothetical protein n=1 Tax=Heyndrickxia coagulans TaxID=1398 RepID=UPI0019D6EBE3
WTYIYLTILYFWWCSICIERKIVNIAKSSLKKVVDMLVASWYDIKVAEKQSDCSLKTGQNETSNSF